MDIQWGQPVAASSDFQYLGVIYHITQDVLEAVQTVAAVGERAM
jgi:hypothetical protein